MSRILYTIGYEGSSISDFLRTVEGIGIEVVIDVRQLPLSRKKGFSKTAFKSFLQDSSIEYLHLRGLGDPKAGRIAAREGRYKDFEKIFGAHMRTKPAQEDLAQAVSVSKKKLACLLCFESDHRHCHRCIVATKMALIGDFSLKHLTVNKQFHFQKKNGLDYVRDSARIG